MAVHQFNFRNGWGGRGGCLLLRFVSPGDRDRNGDPALFCGGLVIEALPLCPSLLLLPGLQGPSDEKRSGNQDDDEDYNDDEDGVVNAGNKLRDFRSLR